MEEPPHLSKKTLQIGTGGRGARAAAGKKVKIQEEGF